MKVHIVLLTLWSLLLAVTSPLHGQAPEAIPQSGEEIVVIKAGKILTISSDPITNGTILLENGKIAAT